VLDAVVNHLKLEAAIGGYEAHDRELAALEHMYDAAAKLINCTPSEIAVIENATRAWDMAFYAIPFKAGDRILTASAEYVSNYIAYLQVAKRTGAVVEVIPNDEYGQTSVEALREMVDERVKLISITHVPTHGGLVNPAVAIGKVARDARVLYLVDACQSVGQMPIDVEQIGCDILSTTGRKFLRGPRGIGFLYVSRKVIEQLEPPFLDMRAASWISRDEYQISPDARRFENWETYYAGKKGLGVAIDYAMSWDVSVTWQRIKKLAERLRDGLSSLDFVDVLDLGKERCGIVTFQVQGMDSRVVKQRLAEDRINVSVSVDENSRLDLTDRGIRNLVRSSVHYYNTDEEVDWFCDRLLKLKQD